MTEDAKRLLLLNAAEIDDLYACAEVHPMHFVKTKPDLAAKIGAAMRPACPEPGDDWSKLMCVLLQPGMSIDTHEHRRHTVLFYPDGTNDPLRVEIPAGYREIYPDFGTVLYLPPGTPHSVPAVRTRRLSVAMLVERSRP